MKKTAAFITGLFLIFALPLGIWAQTTQNFLQGYQTEDDTFRIIMGDIFGQEETYAPENFDVTVSGQEIDVLSVASCDELQIPVTYYCLVDVSGSMKAAQMELAREALSAIEGTMKAEDNMVIATLGNSTVTSGYLSDPQEIDEAISSLETGNEDTNLYAGIVGSINELLTSGSANERKCLIIISDGQDEQKSGITQDEATTAITQSRIPVYTIAALAQNPTKEQVEYGKLLGSFARSSVGGEHYAPVVDDITGADAGAAIAASVAQGLVIELDVSGVKTDKDIVLFHISYKSVDGSSYADDLEVYSTMLPKNEEPESTQVQQTAEPDTETQMEPEEAAEDDSFEMWWVAVIAGAVVLAVVIVVVLVILKRRKKQSVSGQEENAGEDEAEINDQAYPPLGETVSVGDALPKEENPQQENSFAGNAGGYQLRLSAIGYSDISYTVQMEEGKEYTIGRREPSDIILSEEDKKLSGVHCKMVWENGKLYVWDMNSTNGTFINGVPIRDIGKVSLKEGETIRMGSYEYRIG
jgi:hypothetical protein